jgi:hypothetical protein
MAAQARILYLDFDGPLHPDEVFISPRRGIHLADRVAAKGHRLFENVPVLEAVLADFPGVRIILSTSWVRARSFDFARDKLTTPLRNRVIGATFHRRYANKTDFEATPRGMQVMADAARRGLSFADWVAVDDNDEGWTPQARERLVLTDSCTGLGCTSTVDRLRQLLDQRV